MFILTLLIFTMLVVRGSSSNYFFAYFLDQKEIMAFLGNFGFGTPAGRPIPAFGGFGLSVPGTSFVVSIGLV